jgi:hypothetical protein
MRFNQPTLPEGVTGLRFLGLKYLGSTIDYTYNASMMVWNASHLVDGARGLCLIHGCGTGTNCTSVVLKKAPVAVEIGSIDWSDPVSGTSNTEWPRLGPCPQ